MPDLEQRSVTSFAPAGKTAPSAPPETESSQKALPKVNTSYFDKLEQGKEQKFFRLRAENEKLVRLTRQWQDRANHLQETLAEKDKDIKALKRDVQKAQSQRPPTQPRRAEVPADILDEEERMYRELQDKRSGDLLKRARFPGDWPAGPIA